MFTHGHKFNIKNKVEDVDVLVYGHFHTGYIKQDNKIIIPKELLAHFGVHTIGTARGILHCKTEGTQFNTFILPPINVSERITEDIIIKIE